MRSLTLFVLLATSVPGLAQDATAEETREEVLADVTDGPPNLDDRPEELAFADHLFLDGDWYRSITEYRRFLYTVRGRHQDAPRAALAIGEALMRGEQWDAAGRQLDGIAQRTTAGAVRNLALFAAGRAYLLDGRPELAKPRFRLVAQDESAELQIGYEAKWLLAWGHFDAGELDLAYQYFAQLAQAEGRHKDDAQGVAAMLIDNDIPQKNPYLAGALSLIPGLGHFYLGRWGTGITSLVWNAIFLFATTHAWLHGDYGVAVVLTVFELGWYSGGVFGAVAGAYKYNRDAQRNWRDQIIADHGMSRELPPMYRFKDRKDALPGTIFRFGGAF